jgi:hypothetical protein
MMWLPLVILLFLLTCQRTWAPTNYEEVLSLDLLEELLTPLGRGGSCDGLSRITKAIAKSTIGAPAAVQEIGELRRSSHFERDLHNWAARQEWWTFLPQPYEFPCQKDTKHGPQELTHHAMLPHDMFSAIHAHSSELFHELFTGGSDNLLNFWRDAEAEDREWCRRHPVVQKCPDASLRVPFGIHGDDAGAQGSILQQYCWVH